MLRHRSESLRIRQGVGGLALLALAAACCRQDAPTDRVRVSGHVEADDVQLAAEVGGRVLELSITEGDRVTAKRSDVLDWMYQDGEQMVGGFSVKVLAGQE